jgi:hypothetical protein
VLRRADAIVVVLSATQLLAENELQFIETLWSQGHRALTFAVNFVDGLEDYEIRTVRERCVAMLRPFGGVLGENILLVSARHALRARLAGEEAPPAPVARVGEVRLDLAYFAFAPVRGSPGYCRGRCRRRVAAPAG